MVLDVIRQVSAFWLLVIRYASHSLVSSSLLKAAIPKSSAPFSYQRFISLLCRGRVYSSFALHIHHGLRASCHNPSMFTLLPSPATSMSRWEHTLIISMIGVAYSSLSPTRSSLPPISVIVACLYHYLKSPNILYIHIHHSDTLSQQHKCHSLGYVYPVIVKYQP